MQPSEGPFPEAEKPPPASTKGFEGEVGVMQGPATQGEFTVSYRNGCSIHNIARTTKAEACKVLAE